MKNLTENLIYHKIDARSLVSYDKLKRDYKVHDQQLFDAMLDLIFIHMGGLDKKKDWESQKEKWISNYFSWAALLRDVVHEITLVYKDELLVGFSSIRALPEASIADFLLILHPTIQRKGVGRELIRKLAKNFPNCWLVTFAFNYNIIRVCTTVLGSRISPIIEEGQFIDLPLKPFNLQKYLRKWACIFPMNQVKFLKNGVVKGYFMDENGQSCSISREKYSTKGAILPLEEEDGDAVMCVWLNQYES